MTAGGPDAAPDRVNAAVAAALERAMNAWLATDPRAARRLSELEDTVIGLEVSTLQLVLFFFPAAGKVRVSAEAGREPDTWVRGGLFDLLSFGAGGHRAGVNARLVVEGDVGVGQTFQHVLKTGDFDWEELLAARLGDVAAHGLARGLRAAARWTGRSLDSLGAAAGEYLREEARFIPGNHELHEFIREVDELRDRVESLEARAARPRGRQPA